MPIDKNLKGVYNEIMNTIYITKCEKARSHEFLFYILDKFYGVNKNESDLKKTEHGKLYFDGVNFKFNITHKGDLVAVAIFDCEVGIDIEQIKPKDYLKISKKYFGTIPKDEKEFFTLWTKAESFVKYSASSIFTELKKIEIIDDGFVYDGVKQSIKSKSVYFGEYVLSATATNLDFCIKEIEEF